MLFPRKTLGVELEEGTSELNDQEVDSNDDHPDDNEGRIIEEPSAEVELIMDLPGTNHVDDLEPNEEIEDEGHVARGVTVVGVLDNHVKFVTIQLVESTREDHFAILDVHIDNGVELVEA